MNVQERILSKVVISDAGCWEWQGAVTPDGYGFVSYEGKWKRAHRVAYALFKEAIPDGMHLDHLCRVRHCVNPAHLEPVTNAENARRGLAGAHHKCKTHCPHGHPYNEANTYIYNGGRLCRRCRANRAAGRWIGTP